MECDEHGLEHTEPAAVGGSGLKRKHGVGGARDVRLAFAAAVPGAAAARALPLPAHAPRARLLPLPRPPDSPFMSNMDEISYWVYTKRAPCLFNYDSIIKQQSEQAHCSNAKPPSVVSKEEEPSRKKMRKLKLLEEDSISTERQQNVYYKAPQIQKPPTSSCKSEEAGSDIHFNIKASKAPKKSKNLKLQKNCPTRVSKKIKAAATSTPKVVNLRRSLRKAQQSCNNNSHLNSSFEIFNATIVNGKQDLVEEAEPEQATNEQNKSKSRSSGASRYPRRQNNNTETPEANCTATVANSNANTVSKRYNMRKGTLNMNRKENSEEKLVSRTRSGKRRCLQLDVEKSACAVLQLNSSTEPVSSSAAVNVAGPNTRSTRNNASTRCLRSRTLRDKVVRLYKESSSEGSDKKLDGMHCALEQSAPKCVKKVKKSVDRPGQSSCRDSLRDKSGFTACFSDSDSDSDSAPLNQRKFFC